MSTSTAAPSRKNPEVLTDAVLAQTKTRRKEAVQESTDPFANIAANTFVAIILDENNSAEEKAKAITTALVGVGTREENRKRLSEFEEMKEYFQHNRSLMAEEIIRLTDTKAFAELKRVYEEVNDAMLEFDQKMEPLTDVIDAFYTLRTNGVTLEVFKSIREDQAREDNERFKREGLAAEANGIEAKMRENDISMALAGEDKGFFGGIKAASQRVIAERKADNEALTRDLQRVRDAIIATPETTAQDSQFTREKALLRSFLKGSSEEHEKRQVDLVQAALTFVSVTRDRVGSVREHLGLTSEQINNLGDANSHMTQIYAILNEGIKGAEKENQVIRETLITVPADENRLQEMARVEKLGNMDQHIKALDASAADTLLSYTDLTSQTIRINAMSDSVTDQITRARSMHSQGIAGVADRLSVVLQAVSHAAVNESSAMARNTLTAMGDSTNRIAQKEVIRVATGLSDTNDDIIKAMEGLESYGEVFKAGGELRRETVRELRENLGNLEKMAQGVNEDIRSNMAIHGEVGAERNPSASEASAPAGPSKIGANLFKLGAQRKD